MKNKKVLLISLLVLLVGLGGLVGYNLFATRDAVEGNKTITVTVINEKNDYQETHTHQTTATTFGDALEEMAIAEIQDGAYGRFLTGADGYSADESNQEWWRIVVNGQDAETGMDTIMLNDKDAFELILMIGW